MIAEIILGNLILFVVKSIIPKRDAALSNFGTKSIKKIFTPLFIKLKKDTESTLEELQQRKTINTVPAPAQPKEDSFIEEKDRHTNNFNIHNDTG